MATGRAKDAMQEARRRLGSRQLIGATILAVVALVGGLACSHDKTPVPGASCNLNSECDDPLSCTFGKCHNACRVDGDCPSGHRCVRASTRPGAAAAASDAGATAMPLNVCLLDELDHCTHDSGCKAPLVCGRDLRCRNQCESERDCNGAQQCVLGGPSGEKVCAEPEAIFHGDLMTKDEGVAPDRGVPGTPATADGGSDGGSDAVTTSQTDAPVTPPAAPMEGMVVVGPPAAGNTPPPGAIVHIDAYGSTSLSKPFIWQGAHVIRGRCEVRGALTLSPDATVWFDPGAELVVATNGGLYLKGTEGHPVRLTSSKIAPGPGDWRGITIAGDSGETVMENVVVEYAGIGISGRPSVSFENVSITKPLTLGMSIPNDVRLNKFTGIKITDAGTSPLAVGPDILGLLSPFVSTGAPTNAVVVDVYQGLHRAATWQNLGVPLLFFNNSYFNIPVPVTVAAGTRFLMAEGLALYVKTNGSLKAAGTAEAPVVFTSTKPAPGPGDWGSVNFLATASTDSALENTILEYGGAGNTNTLGVEAGAHVALSNVTVRKTLSTGIAVGKAAQLSRFEAITVEDAGGYPVFLDGSVVGQLTSLTSARPKINAIGVEWYSTAVSAPAIWHNFGLPYLIKADSANALKINAPLTIEAGTELQLGNIYLDVANNGSLRALGTMDKHVVLRSWKVSPQPGDWGSVHVFSTAAADSLLRFAELRHGGLGTKIGAVIIDKGAQIGFESSLFEKNKDCDVLGTPASATETPFMPCVP